MSTNYTDAQPISMIAWCPRPFTTDEYEAMCLSLSSLHDVVVKEISEPDGLSFVVEAGKLREVSA